LFFHRRRKMRGEHGLRQRKQYHVVMCVRNGGEKTEMSSRKRGVALHQRGRLSIVPPSFGGGRPSWVPTSEVKKTHARELFKGFKGEEGGSAETTSPYRGGPVVKGTRPLLEEEGREKV